MSHDHPPHQQVSVLQRLDERRDRRLRLPTHLAEAEGGVKSLDPIRAFEPLDQLREGWFRAGYGSAGHESLLDAVRVRSDEPSVYRPAGGVVLGDVAGWGMRGGRPFQRKCRRSCPPLDILLGRGSLIRL
jgi:hypothetical protein